MSVSPLPGVFNQGSWPGVGDWDECFALSAYWALVASGYMTRAQLPSIAAFRAAAGVPDAPGSTGATNAQALRAIKTLTPQSGAFAFDSASYDALATWLAKGAVASVTVRSSALPARLQFGFAGIHQVDLVAGLLLMNPLDQSGHALRPIARAEFGHAAHAYLADGKIHAIVFPEVRFLGEIRALAKRVADLTAQLATLPPDTTPFDEAYVARAVRDAVTTNEARWRVWLDQVPK